MGKYEPVFTTSVPGSALVTNTPSLILAEDTTFRRTYAVITNVSDHDIYIVFGTAYDPEVGKGARIPAGGLWEMTADTQTFAAVYGIIEAVDSASVLTLDCRL